ncbi:MAG TPA: hypothetical protein PKM44_13000, partial [Turneriella sp.]|nr:hypothetical protein [Turneriella sp.]
LTILTWERLDASLGLGEQSAGAAPAVDAVDAVDVGLFVLRGTPADGVVPLRRSEVVEGESDGPVAYTLHEIVWDGTDFKVKVTPGKTWPRVG